VVLLSLLYLYCCGFSVKERLTFLLMLAVGLIVVHGRFYGFFILTCAILMFFYRPEMLLSKLRTGIVMALVLGATIYISESQITGYLSAPSVEDTDSGFAARATLYRTAGIILKDYFPLGSGFASFASHASKTYYSPIYSDYGLNSVNGLTLQEWFPVSDSYYPSLAQFGFVGIVLYLLFWAYVVRLAFSKLRKKGEMQSFVVILILISFVFIENIFDSFFTSNKGVFMMMFLGILFGKPDVVTIRRRKSKQLALLETTRLTAVENASGATAESEEETPEDAGKARDEEKIAELPAIEAPVTPEPVREVEPSGNGANEEADYEYEDFEEYCEDESDIDSETHERPRARRPETVAGRNDAAVVDKAVRTEEEAGTPEKAPDEHVFDEDEDDGENDYWIDDSYAEASSPSKPQNETELLKDMKKDMDKEQDMDGEFQEALKKIKARAEEKRRLLKEKETDNADGRIRKDDNPERFDYII
jgi:hypothetical protein